MVEGLGYVPGGLFKKTWLLHSYLPNSWRFVFRKFDRAGRFFVFGVGTRKNSNLEETNGWLEKIHPGKLAWNPKMKAWKMIFPFQRGEHFRFHAGFRGSFHGNRSGWKNDPSLLGVVSEFLFFFQILWQSHSQRPFLEKELRLHTVCFGALVFEDHGAVTDYPQGSKKLQNIRQHDTAYVYPRVLAIVMWPSRDRENQWLENLCPSWNSPLLGDILVFRGVNGPLHKKQQTTKDTRTTPPRSWKPMPLRKRQGALGFKQPKKSTSTVVPVSFLRRRHRSLKNMVGRKKQNSSFCFFLLWKKCTCSSISTVLSETSLKYQGHGSRENWEQNTQKRRAQRGRAHSESWCDWGPMSSHIVPFVIQVNHGRNSCESWEDKSRWIMIFIEKITWND